LSQSRQPTEQCPIAALIAIAALVGPVQGKRKEYEEANWQVRHPKSKNFFLTTVEFLPFLAKKKVCFLPAVPAFFVCLHPFFLPFYLPINCLISYLKSKNRIPV
jgi:hypothetical protein